MRLNNSSYVQCGEYSYIVFLKYKCDANPEALENAWTLCMYGVITLIPY